MQAIRPFRNKIFSYKKTLSVLSYEYLGDYSLCGIFFRISSALTNLGIEEDEVELNEDEDELEERTQCLNSIQTSRRQFHVEQ